MADDEWSVQELRFTAPFFHAEILRVREIRVGEERFTVARARSVVLCEDEQAADAAGIGPIARNIWNDKTRAAWREHLKTIAKGPETRPPVGPRQP